jgi:hypothetical protein
MSGLELFLGFPMDEVFQKSLKKNNPYLVSFLIGQKDYLQEASYEGMQYLGKCVEAYPTLDQLSHMEIHLISLLKRLAPQYPFQSNPLKLLTLNERS